MNLQVNPGYKQIFEPYRRSSKTPLYMSCIILPSQDDQSSSQLGRSHPAQARCHAVFGLATAEHSKIRRAVAMQLPCS